ncbi:hypothetical protein M670_03970 [Schinkia azotoformans MEV2011]|uniref:DUF58 domain-containing protein n=1 Tax=Schinkia azotoformans MEV2011 TaxID=1348973 RepID=A0A072NJ00_SCHAZ|nr:DUF58 domain-containing protein [Schinkia azotoformans]KEF36888.1 hypothetical protein M670_03970 [Schinkia azotoformans MEV2011]MEC1695262.1 DUF58 domain-containing protein [Schinkia azotoformans]MEC1717564.1 DUF58 domain-containing protein [Schinkia azotoformans]MEC1723719.1 DUF58 domain-containing protein [Schinkia azotoformans]MEC1742486.1 DUF58 domain-containing protein [Schinkia azotoformans]
MKVLYNLLKIWGKVLLLLAGVGILYAYAMFQGGFVSWFLLYSFLPFIIFSILFALYPIQLWKVERIIIDGHKMYEAGDTVKVQIQITRKFPFPLYFLMVTDTFRMGQGEKKVIRFPFLKRRIHFTYNLDELPRGEHFFENITATSADFLGFIKKEHSFKAESKLIVYPKRQRLNLFFLEKHIGEGSLARGLDYKKEMFVPTTIREYQRGDRLSWINWKATARKNTLISKEFEIMEDHQYVICIDRYHLISHEAFEKIVLYSASIINELYKAGHPVTLISTGEGEDRSIFSAKKSVEWMNQVFYHFAIVKNDSPSMLHQVVEKDKAALPERGTIIFITDNMTPHFLEWIKRLANNQRKVVVVLSMADGSAQNYSNQVLNQNIIIKAMDEVKSI